MTNKSITPIQPANLKRRCTATCADGSPCRAWAVRTSDPPRCAPHGGGRARVGAPARNQNAVTHGFYASKSPPPWDGEPACSIDTVIADLYAKYQRLSRYIDENMDHLSTAEFARLTSLHGQSASRLGRLLRDRRILQPEEDGMSSAIEQALKELGEEWGVDLCSAH